MDHLLVIICQNRQRAFRHSTSQNQAMPMPTLVLTLSDSP